MGFRATFNLMRLWTSCTEYFKKPISKENYLCKFSFHIQNTRGSKKNTGLAFSASVAWVILVLFSYLKISTIPSDEQSKNWQKNFIYITLFSAILITWIGSYERQTSKNLPVQN